MIYRLQAEKAAGKTTVAVSLMLLFPETQLPDCDVAFVEMIDEWKGWFSGVMERVMR